jgi:hypothetical protein
MHKINKKTIIIFTLPFILIICFYIAFKGVNYHDTRQSHQILGIGDSMMLGTFGTKGGPLPTLSTYTGLSYMDEGINGVCINTGVSNISGWMTSYTPSRVYSNYGINDIRGNTGHTDLSGFITAYGTILTYVSGAGGTLYPMEITPDCSEIYKTGVNFSNAIKQWNANLEDFAYTHNLPMTPTYQEMSNPSTSYDDCLLSAYNSSGDGLHPGSSGDTVYGYLTYKSAIPTRSRDWGNSAYPAFGHESWSWWVITGTGSISGGTTDSVTGHLKGGSLYLSNGANAVSDVLAILPNSKSISITLNVTQGTPVISYRTSTSNFTRTSASSWTIYTMPFTLTSGTAQFIQIKISNRNATELHVDTLTLNWND